MACKLLEGPRGNRQTTTLESPARVRRGQGIFWPARDPVCKPARCRCSRMSALARRDLDTVPTSDSSRGSKH